MAGVWGNLMSLVVSVLLVRQVQACSEEGRFGPQCAYVCHCSEQCDRSSGQCPGQCVQPWSGPSCQRENVAYNKTGKSSGVYEAVKLWSERKAVDGNRNQYVYANSCFHSSEYSPPNSSTPAREAWFYLDLGRQYHTHSITLYGRGRNEGFSLGPSRLNNTRLTVSDTPKDRNNPCFTFTGHSSRGDNIVDLTCDKEGRYVTLYTNYLHPSEAFVLLEICELEVYVCSNGTYGDSCDKLCHCKDGLPCDDVTGRCPQGCMPGFQGESCNQLCASGRFGADCAEECHCRDGSCDHVTGAGCQGRCAAGFLGNTCSSRCQETQFGENCASTCHCGTPGCDTMNGTCHVPGCLSGYTGHDCNTDVDECAETAHVCAENTVCVNTPGAFLCVPYSQTDCTHRMAVVGGGVAGGSVLLLLLLAVLFLGCRRRRRRQPKEAYNTTKRSEMVMPSVYTTMDAVQSSGRPQKEASCNL